MRNMPQNVIRRGSRRSPSSTSLASASAPPNPQSPIPNLQSSSAFTSIELLVVIAVALLIMALMGVVWRNIEAKNRRSTAQAQIADIAGSLSDYFCEQGCNPNSVAAISNRLPRTFTAFSTNGIPLDPWGNEYQASTNSAGQWTVFSCGPDGAASTDDDNIVAGRF
jgi:type II secretory pathway pseudopilin PulG